MENMKNIIDYKIFFECNTDKFFINENIVMLDFKISDKYNLKHSGCHPKVFSDLKKHDGKGLGFADFDSRNNQSSEVINYRIIDRCHLFRLGINRNNKNKIVIMAIPNIEECFLYMSKKYNINPNDFDLINTFDAFHDYNPEYDINYANFIIELMKVSEEIKKVQSWILSF